MSVAIMEVCGTAIETMVVFWLWGSLWERWSIGFKVATPILHLLFSAAQAWGAYVFWQLSKKEKRKARGIVRASFAVVEETDSFSSQEGKSSTDIKDIKKADTAVDVV